MRLKVEINKLARCPLKDSFFASVIKSTLLEAGPKSLKNKSISVSLAVVSEKEIKKTNCLYRKNNSATDILSFAEYKSAKALQKEESCQVFLGELILCYNDIVKHCRKNKLNLESELGQTISHGVLHLLGFKHGKKMFEIQNKINKNGKN